MTTVLCNIAIVGLLVGFSTPGVVLAVRALPPVDRRVLASIKPWACDICMSFWTTGALAMLVATVMKDWRLLLSCGPAYSISLMLIRFMTRAPEDGPLPPMVEDGLAEKLEGR